MFVSYSFLSQSQASVSRFNGLPLLSLKMSGTFSM